MWEDGAVAVAAWLTGLPAAAPRALPACRRGFSGRDGEEAGGRRAARGRCPPGEVAVDWLTGLPAAAPRALPACRRGFSGRDGEEAGGGAVPLEGVALSLWGIRPISEKEQVPPGKRTCGPFPIRNLFLF